MWKLDITFLFKCKFTNELLRDTEKIEGWKIDFVSMLFLGIHDSCLFILCGYGT
jgi:hypothetical protein